MTYGVSNGHVTDDVTWPKKVFWGSTVGYPSDSLASCNNSGYRLCLLWYFILTDVVYLCSPAVTARQKQ